MKCPRCKVEMVAEGIVQIVGDKAYQTMVCPSCGYVLNHNKPKVS